MNADSNQFNAIPKTISAGTPPVVDSPASLSSTMRIPVEEVFDDIEIKHVYGLQIKMPGKCEPESRALQNRKMTIGREDNADIVIPLNSVSREHACILPQHEEFVIEDLNSTNGTYVNGIRVNRCILRHNDLIRIGDVTILFSQQKQWGLE